MIGLVLCLASVGFPCPVSAQDPGSVPSPSPRSPADSGWTAATAVPLTGRAMQCEAGRIQSFECHNVTLLAFLPLSVFRAPTDSVSLGMTDMWGWVDPKTGREFALLCLSTGTAFVEVTNPLHPTYLGMLPARRGPVFDLKVYDDHVFIVGERMTGMQIFDLTQLLTEQGVPRTWQETAYYDEVGFAAHNLAINVTTGFAYAVGSRSGGEPCGGGLHMIDIRTPTRPVFAGCYRNAQAGGYVHDAQCIVYHGPDARYHGRELCANASVAGLGRGSVEVVDVTEKQRPISVGIARYPFAGFTHQGWFTDDHRYFFLGDEGDGGLPPGTTRTMVFDVSTLDDPVLATVYHGTTTAGDHNLYIRGDYIYQANTDAGLRVADIRDPVHPTEVGFFDPTPGTGRSAHGAWTSYPYFSNGTIGVSTTHEGLFLLRLASRGSTP